VHDDLADTVGLGSGLRSAYIVDSKLDGVVSSVDSSKLDRHKKCIQIVVHGNVIEKKKVDVPVNAVSSSENPL
jgi:hypothetical protein